MDFPLLNQKEAARKIAFFIEDNIHLTKREAEPLIHSLMPFLHSDDPENLEHGIRNYHELIPLIFDVAKIKQVENHYDRCQKVLSIQRKALIAKDILGDDITLYQDAEKTTETPEDGKVFVLMNFVMMRAGEAIYHITDKSETLCLHDAEKHNIAYMLGEKYFYILGDLSESKRKALT